MVNPITTPLFPPPLIPSESLPTSEQLPYDDGEPLETNRHRIAMNMLIISLEQAWGDRRDYFVGGNMFIYYNPKQLKNRDFRGPDFFVVKKAVDKPTRKSWVVWEENNTYPDVVIELMSESTADVDKGPKKKLYERTWRTKDYFIFDPYDPESLEGWHLGETGRYRKLKQNAQGWLWSEELGMWLGMWSGTWQRETTLWLRFYDREGNLILLPEEVQKLRAQQEQLRAQQERERAEQERERAQQERERAQQEQLRAQQERERAEQAEVALAQERRQKQALLERLQALGIELE